MDKLKNMNNLSGSLLSVGQKLIISEDVGIGDDFYIVQKGDTLYSIARKFNLAVDDLKKLNNLDSNLISVGQKLKITKVNDEEVLDNDSYVVQKGDSLYKIANMFNTTVDKLKELNNLVNNNLSIGQILKITDDVINNNKNEVYTVKSGDTLYSIARKFNTSVSLLAELNNLDSVILSIGQKLLIP